MRDVYSYVRALTFPVLCLSAFFALFAYHLAIIEFRKDEKPVPYFLPEEVAHTKEVKELLKGFPEQEVIVAVIDTGIDFSHRELLDSAWTNSGETGLDQLGRDKATNGIDDDQNGYVDDVHGWDFADRSPILKDANSHGTHMAGIIQAVAASPNVKLMYLRYWFDPFSGHDNLNSTVEAIDYAVAMGADIINYSAGGMAASRKEYEAIQRAQQRGVMFITSAGNEGANTDLLHYYPGSYGLENVVSVAEIDSKGNLRPLSNFGSTVSIAAQGYNLMATLPDGKWGIMSGTSTSAALFTGVAALLLSSGPYFDAKDVAQAMLENAEPRDSLNHFVKSNGKLDPIRTAKALLTISRCEPNKTVKTLSYSESHFLKSY